jgi:ATP-dependent Zn protease
MKADKRRIAHHEAGHAVIARMLGVDVVRASILPTNKERGGSLNPSAEHLAGDDAQARLRGLETDAKIALAGPNAEKKYRPETNVQKAQREQWRDDLAVCTSAAINIVLLRDDPSIRFNFTGARDFEPTETQAAEIRQLVNRFSREAQTLVEQHWPAITRVAAALLDRKILYNDEIAALINAPGDAAPGD